MARPKKIGLDYFPTDVDIFENDKLFDVQIKYGPLGEVIYLRLLCLTYKNGYYYKFDSLDKLAAMLIKSIGNRWAREKDTVKDVISFLAECNLFSSELMQENILTSRGIQLRYLIATERRKSHMQKYCLLEKNDFQVALKSVPQSQISVTQTGVSATETQVNVDNNEQSKVKKSKEKQSKVVVSIPAKDGMYQVTELQLQQLRQEYNTVNVIQSLENLVWYLEHNPNKRKTRAAMTSYMHIWLKGDKESGKCPAKTAERVYGAAYDLEAYENADPFAD